MRSTDAKAWGLATLRRDRGLFALVGICIILLGTVLSPTKTLATPGGGQIICALASEDAAGKPDTQPSSAADHCAACLAARSGFDDLPLVDLGVFEPAFQSPARTAEIVPLVPAASTDGQSRPGDPPPLIRGPPSVA